MRHLLALLIGLGLLLAPLATAAAACHDHMGANAAEARVVTGPSAPIHDCCDDEGGPSAPSHDLAACALACALMGGPTAVLVATTWDTPAASERSRLAPVSAAPLSAHPPPALERPPKPLA
jgi:hypothetical protein